MVLDCPKTLWEPGKSCPHWARWAGWGSMGMETVCQHQLNGKGEEAKIYRRSTLNWLDKPGLPPGESFGSFHNYFLDRRKIFTNLYDFEHFYTLSNVITQKECMVLITKEKVMNSCLHSVTFCNRRYTWAEESLSTWNLQGRKPLLAKQPCPQPLASKASHSKKVLPGTYYKTVAISKGLASDLERQEEPESCAAGVAPGQDESDSEYENILGRVKLQVTKRAISDQRLHGRIEIWLPPTKAQAKKKTRKRISMRKNGRSQWNSTVADLGAFQDCSPEKRRIWFLIPSSL